MLDNKDELRKIIQTVTELFSADRDFELSDLLRTSEITSELNQYDNWYGITIDYSIRITVSVDKFVKIQDRQSEIEARVKEKIELVLRSYEDVQIGQVYITPKYTPKIEWDRIADIFTKEQLILEVNYLKETMISVSTGRQRIQDVNNEYQKRFALVDKALKILAFENPNTFVDLWQWYAKWKSDEMRQYQDRRVFIGEMYGNLLKTLQETEHSKSLNISVDLTGWERIDRTVRKTIAQLKQASNEEEFQAIGLLCRETIISIAQAIYNENRHPTLDGVKASKTDAKRMLDAYISVKLAGGSNENLRKYAKSSIDLANELTMSLT